jgi:hypothetical protein
MEKAYDFKDLGLRLKGRGLDIAEEASKVVIEEVLAWVEDSAKLSATPYDDMAVFIVPKVKDLALKYADKIDGQVG